MVLLVLQILLVVTGGAVRLTGSGLGCPTWPECTKGSYSPTADQVEGAVRPWIEFGNRLLTFALVIAAIGTTIYLIRKKRKDLYLLAFGQIAGILGQAVLGGITVLTDLNPIPVAGHLLLSMVLISGATSLVQYWKTPRIVARPTGMIATLSRVHVLMTFAVLVLGTIVTGSGPHAGDWKAPRFHFDIRTIAWIHADVVIALLGISLALWVATSGSATYATARHRAAIFLLVALAQGAIGYTQYFNGLPQIIVGAHLLGAALVWVAAWRLRLSITRRMD